MGKRVKVNHIQMGRKIHPFGLGIRNGSAQCRNMEVDENGVVHFEHIVAGGWKHHCMLPGGQILQLAEPFPENDPPLTSSSPAHPVEDSPKRRPGRPRKQAQA